MSGLTLVLGGVRSGKSAFAEGLAAAAGPRVLYVATAVASDVEMEERIRRHRARRPAAWELVEEPFDLTSAIGVAGLLWNAILLDSISGWLSNLVFRRLSLDGSDGTQAPVAALEQEVMAAVADLIARQCDSGAHLIAVSDEAGLSLVPPNHAGRLFQDLLGTVNQALAASAERVYLVVAGLPLQLKGASVPPHSAAS